MIMNRRAGPDGLLLLIACLPVCLYPHWLDRVVTYT